MRESWTLEQRAGTKQQRAVLREHGAFSPSLHFFLQTLTCEVSCYESDFVMFHCVWDPLEKSNMNVHEIGVLIVRCNETKMLTRYSPCHFESIERWWTWTPTHIILNIHVLQSFDITLGK